MKRFTQVYILIMIAELVAIYNKNLYPWLEYISKPLIVLSLILFILTYTKGVKLPFKKWILTALVFSWFGDILLMFTDLNSNVFLFGLIAFLISQGFYIVAFSKTAHASFDIPIFKKYPWMLLIPYGYAAFIYSELKGDLGDMSIPVMIYVLVISTMLAFAMNRYGKVSNSSFTWILFGAILFVSSDSILAINKFHHAIEYSRYLIMFTYMSAQYFIVHGAIRQIEEQSSI
jgi:uncharacterized membrane protein YhhN